MVRSSLFPRLPLLLVLAVCVSSGLQSAAQETMHHEKASAPSTSLTVQVADRTVSLNRSDLEMLPQTTLEVQNAHTKQAETYSGPLLSDVLAKAGLTLSEATQHKVLDSCIIATGTDGYFVVYSGTEVQPGLSRSQVIVAIAQSGQPLTRTGAFQLVDSEDRKPARWVRNLSRLSVSPVAADLR